MTYFLCKCDNFMLIVFPGLSSDTDISSSAGDSDENTKEIAPSNGGNASIETSIERFSIQTKRVLRNM